MKTIIYYIIYHLKNTVIHKFYRKMLHHHLFQPKFQYFKQLNLISLSLKMKVMFRNYFVVKPGESYFKLPKTIN